MIEDPALPSRPEWTAVLLVCRACRKRSDGPRGFGAKSVAREAQRALRADGSLRPRPRVVACGCLGLCPKAATAIALAGPAGGPRIAPARSLEAVGPIVAGLVAAARDTPG
jgi:hypothetical protein